MLAQIYLKRGALVIHAPGASMKPTSCKRAAVSINGEELIVREGEVLHIPRGAHQSALEDTPSRCVQPNPCRWLGAATRSIRLPSITECGRRPPVWTPKRRRGPVARREALTFQLGDRMEAASLGRGSRRMSPPGACATRRRVRPRPEQRDRADDHHEAFRRIGTRIHVDRPVGGRPSRRRAECPAPRPTRPRCSRNN